MKKKQITLTVTVSGPAWMTKAMAKREVRALINNQSFYGSYRPVDDPLYRFSEEIDQFNFRARSVK